MSAIKSTTSTSSSNSCFSSNQDNYCLQVAVALSRTKESAVEAHARDELGIDLDDLANPFQVSSRMTPLMDLLSVEALWTRQPLLCFTRSSRVL